MSENKQNFEFASEWLKIATGTVNIVFAIGATIGNLLVIFVIIRSPSLKTRSNVLLASLAMTDLLVGVLLDPLTILMLFSERLRQVSAVNLLRRFVSVLLIGASIGSIGVISYDRYIHLSKLTRYNQYMTKRRMIVSVIVAWLAPIIVPLFRVFTKNEKIHSSIIVLYILTCFIVMCTSYITILVFVSKKQRSLQNSGSNASDIKNSIRAAKVITLIIICFLFMVTPIMIYNFILAAQDFGVTGLEWFMKTKRDNFYLLAMTVVQANSTINPIIYYFKNPAFQKQFWRAMSCKYDLVQSNNSKSSQEAAV